MANNEEVLNGFYVPEEDFLIPGKSNIDWGLQVPSDNTAVSFAGGLLDPNTGNMSGMQMPELDLSPQRKRRAGSNIAALGLVDIIEGLSGDPNAYIGRSMARANAFDEERSKEDPEGYQIDLNRAKVLSQKAYQETDPVKKAMYGREIKKLLPRETQGLDDITAADMFTSNEKVELERLKQAGRLQLQQLKNSGNMDVAALKASSAEEINQAKLDTKWDIATLNNEYKKAIADGNNERAITVAQMITDRQTDLAMLNNAAKLKQTEMQQTGQNYRTAMQQEGAMSRTLAQNASREDIARMRADTAREQIAGRERVAQINAEARIKSSSSGVGKQQAKDDMDRANWANIEARHNYQNSRFNEALDLMSKHTVFGPLAGRATDWGWGSSEALEAKGRIKSILTSAVEERLKAVREAAGTAKAADSEKEGARVIGYLTGDSTVPQETIMGALRDFMETSDRALQLRKNELFGSKSQVSNKELGVGQSVNVGGFKVTRRQ